MKEKVVISKCDNYEQNSVDDAIRSSLEYFGGMSAFVKKGDGVFLKVNMLWAANPKKCVTTHPAIVEGVAKLVLKSGGIPVIGDSPGGPYNRNSLEKAYRVCGFAEVAERLGILCNTDTSVKGISIADSILIKRADIIKPACDADVIINLPKAKTHEYTYLTGATKNLFGLVPGFQKAGYHSNLKNPENFSKMLLDIAFAMKPAISIMDAVLAMEGSGPAAGNPRKVGAIITGTDVTAVDMVISTIMGIEPFRVPTISAASKHGLGPRNIQDIQISGEPIENFRMKDFKLPLTLAKGGGFGFFLTLFQPFLTEMLSLKPVIDNKKCKRCNICVDSCPEKTIDSRDDIITINHKNCIRCYCCHEMCPHHAIYLKQTFLNRLSGIK